jgi:DNA-binding NarL/FixJ family response regulator
VALDLPGGREVAEIARHRGRSVATTRTHLARLLEKTGTNRQIDLIRVLLRVPLGGRAGEQAATPCGD